MITLDKLPPARRVHSDPGPSDPGTDWLRARGAAYARQHDPDDDDLPGTVPLRSKLYVFGQGAVRG